MEQNLTPTEISNPFKTGTRVFWFTNERSKRVFHAGTVTGYEYVDMPWKLYVIAEDKTERTALLHPERLGGKLKDMRLTREQVLAAARTVPMRKGSFVAEPHIVSAPETLSV